MITVADRLELTELADRYAHYADQRRLEQLSALFTEDAVLAVPDPPRHMRPAVEATGREAIANTCAALMNVAATLHAIVGHVFDSGETDDEAEGNIACIAHHVVTRPDGSAVDFAWHLHYRDRYRIVDGRWLISHRTLDLHWIEQRPVAAVETSSWSG